MWRAGIDIGGTFTDIVIQDEERGTLAIDKVPTTPAAQEKGALQGLYGLLEQVGASPTDLSQVIHATTICSNVLLEQKGTGTGLIVTKGFADCLRLGRQKRPDLYDIDLLTSPPIISKRFIAEVTERIDYAGNVVIPLEEKSIVKAVVQLKKENVKSVAVCLIFSFINPEHERRVRKIIQKVAPEMIVSLSSEISPVWREYERMNTTVANAYIIPHIKNYLGKMRANLKEKGYTRPLFILQSGGGLSIDDVMLRFPIWMLESGPAGGALMAATYLKLIGYKNALSFDMGGTTAKGCLIENQKPNVRGEIEVARRGLKPASGLSITIPAIDMIEVSAGGGSICRTELGTIQVGPESAGADPGPACYGIGGKEATVTDADLVLGYLNPDYFNGGRIKLDKEAATKAIAEKVAKPLGMDIPSAAWSIYEIVNTSMELALRVISIERGYDLRDFVFIGFGGAGPVHGCRLAKGLYMRKAIFPGGAGVGSAIGLLVAEPKFDLVRTKMVEISEEILGTANDIYEEMTAEGKKLLKECGITTDILFIRSVSTRFHGQGFEIPVPLPNRKLVSGDSTMLKKAFNECYFKEYGYIIEDVSIEACTWHLSCVGPTPKVEFTKISKTGGSAKEAIKQRRKAYFPEFKGYVDCDIYDYYLLPFGATITGPAIIEQKESTIIIPPNDMAEVDEWGNIAVTLN